MAERTKRGEEDQKREEEQVRGEPVGARAAGNSDPQAANTTRDKGVEPSKDAHRDGRGQEEK